MGNKPRLSVSARDIFDVFFSLQRALPYHIANTGNYRPLHSKRKLDTRIQQLFYISFQTYKRARKGKEDERNVLTRRIFTYITTRYVARISKPNSYMSTSKLITHVNLHPTFKYCIKTFMQILVKSHHLICICFTRLWQFLDAAFRED